MFDTAVDVAMRDAAYKPDPNGKGVWPKDKQGYTQISSADTAENYARTQKQWNKHETTFTAPSDMVRTPDTYICLPRSWCSRHYSAVSVYIHASVMLTSILGTICLFVV